MSGSRTAFFRGENPLRADKLNTAFSERVLRSGDTMQGMLSLWRDPVAPFDAATKQYVDAHGGGGGGGGGSGSQGALIGASPPGTVPGPLWWDSMSGQLYIQYNDGNSTQWVSANSVAASNSTSIINVLEHGAKGDGTTDDTAAIQAVLDAYAGRAVVFIPKTSTSYRTTQLTIPSDTDLLLHGTLFALAGLISAYVISNNTSNISIRGHGTIDANGPAQVNGVSTPLAGVGFYDTTNVRISGVTITNSYHWPIFIARSGNVVLDGITLTKGGAASGFTANCSDCWIVNSEIDGTGNGDYAWSFYGGVINSGAIGNVVKNAGAGTGSSPPGIGILSDGVVPEEASGVCRDILIANNVCHDNNGPGISILNVATPTGGKQSGIVIADNRCYNNCKTGSVAGNVADIYIDQATGVTVSGNNISRNGNAARQVAGILIGPTASHIGIFNNQIYNTGQGRTDGSGIWVMAANYLFVSGNYIYDDQTTHTMIASVVGEAGTNNTFIGNNFAMRPAFSLASDTIFTGPSSTVSGALDVTGLGISYSGGHAVSFNWTGTAISVKVDGIAVGNIVVGP